MSSFAHKTSPIVKPTSQKEIVMTQSVYSWMGSPLHLVLEDDLALAYNEAQDAWFKAQTDHETRTGSPWEPTEPLEIEWTNRQRTAWNSIASVINLLVEINGGGLDIPEEQITSDHLEKL